MKFFLTEGTLRYIVENYYRQAEGFDGVLSINCGVKNIGPIGRSLVGLRVATLSFEMNGKINLDGVDVDAKTFPEQSDIEDIIKCHFEKDIGRVGKMSFDYDIDPNDRNKGKFNGVMVEAYVKQNAKGGK